MSRTTVDLFVEDRAHEEFLKSLLRRLAREEEKSLAIQIRSARGGHGCVLEELVLYQRSVAKGIVSTGLPDLLVVAIDSNCKSLSRARRDIEAKLERRFRERSVLACPDPHIERWYLADPDSFKQVVGIRPTIGKRKCERERFKRILAKAVVDGGHPATLGGIEFAREIVESMNLYRAGRAETSLKHFLDEATARLRQM